MGPIRKWAIVLGAMLTVAGVLVMRHAEIQASSVPIEKREHAWLHPHEVFVREWKAPFEPPADMLVDESADDLSPEAYQHLRAEVERERKGEPAASDKSALSPGAKIEVQTLWEARRHNHEMKKVYFDRHIAAKEEAHSTGDRVESDALVIRTYRTSGPLGRVHQAGIALLVLGAGLTVGGARPSRGGAHPA